MKYRRVDLNLLHVFDTVMRERSLTKAAKTLDLTPSAVSHALARLRHALKDELFLREGVEMKPTPRALELAASVRGSLATLESVLTQTPFVPAESVRTFRLAAGEYAGVVLLPGLLDRLAATAPHVNLEVVPVNRVDIGQQLERGGVDLVFGWFDTIPQGLRRRALITDSGVHIVRDGHPLTREPLTLERIFDFPHAVVDLTGREGGVGDGFLDDQGLRRRVWMEATVLEAAGRSDLSARVSVKVPSFAFLPPIVSRSDIVATLPERLAHRAVAQGGITILDRLREPINVTAEMVWHWRGDNDEGLRWLLDVLTAVGQEIDPA